MAEGTLAQLYKQAIEEAVGVIARIDDEGDVVFKIPSIGTLYFSVSENDPAYLHLVFPVFADDREFNGDRMAMMMRANDVVRTTKVVKISLREKDDRLVATATAEMFVAGKDALPTLEMLRSVIERCIDVVCLGAKEFVEKQ